MNHPNRRNNKDQKGRSSGDSTSSSHQNKTANPETGVPPPVNDPAPEDPPALALLLDELRLIAVAGHYNVNAAVNIEKARNILEATAGDVLTAAQLYWDDYLATLQQQQEAPVYAPPQLAAAAEPVYPPEYRRLEPLPLEEFVRGPPQVHLADPVAMAEPIDDEEMELGSMMELGNFSMVLGASSNKSSARDFVQCLSKFEETIRKRDADQLHDDDHGPPWPSDEGASVSDDEKVFIRRRNSHQYTSHRRLLQHLARTCDPETISVKRRKLNPDDGNDEKGGEAKDKTDEDDDDDGYLSDNDWMWESLAATSSSAERSLVSPPTDILWGSTAVHDLVLPETEEEKEATIIVNASAVQEDMSNKWSLDNASVMVAADEVVSSGFDVLEGPSKLTASNPMGIPRTWLSASFHMVSTTLTPNSSTKVMGLALKAPQEDDLAYSIWKQDLADANARHPTIPLPYHCRGITSVLSIVTGLLYAGVTVVGQITCHSSRTPLQEVISNESSAQQSKPSKKNLSKGEQMYQQLISMEQSNREYDARLVDALTALLYIAAQASMQRKQNALRDLQSSSDPADQRRWQKIQRKLRLVPTCSWDGIPSISDTFPECDFCNIPIATSYTNMEDLRSYVLSNLRTFTSSGGCALFLETIIRIHGKGAVMHMMRQARKKAGRTGKDVSAPLIHCTCRARHFEKLDADPVFCQTLKAQSKKGIIQDTTPTGHHCVSIELLSLLLVGRVHSTWHGWYPAPLGIGILSNTPGEMGRCLARPEKPVWILRGPTCYSVLWLNGCNEHEDTFSRIDRPGAVAAMTHWNTWYEERNASQLRLVTDRSQSRDASVKDDDDAEFERALERCTSPVLRVMARRRRADTIRAQEIAEVEMGNPDLLLLHDELERLVVHLEDPKFYPNNYHLWRFDLGEDPKEAQASDDCKQRGQVWKSYYKLTDREKLIVEAKLGPQICTLLWTRWPRAKVDRFVPGGGEDPAPIV